MIDCFYCPSCQGRCLSGIHDYERNLRIFKCDTCGEAYAVRDEDIYNFGIEQIFREWHGSYAHQKRLEVRDD